jgi:N-acetyl-1-D-myo-inositol-2-amino-2-deoxy-alpha-D-glucopyranoside deacetylase
MTQRRLLACFAHPDDEAFSVSGILAAMTARGIAVRLVCATSGEEGDIRTPGTATRETLGQVRYHELCQSCQVLGIEPPIMLGY